VSGRVELDVKTGSGSISVKVGGDGVVSVHGTIQARKADAEAKVRRLEASPPIRQNGNVIHIGEIEDRDLRRNVSISYEIVVPADTELVVKSGSGSQSIGNVAGPVKASSGSGSLQIGRIGGNVTASAGSGSVQVEAVQGALRVETGSGSVVVEETAGDTEIETGSGTVRVHGIRGALEVSTGSGGIEAEGDLAGDWRLSASSGGIRVRVPSDAAFELSARTSSGHIDSDHPVTVVGKLSRREMNGTVRGGGHRLELRTSSGSIRIR
jgi:DUF4097 and DUF4098 domain-containing protein YvlB